MFHSFATGVYVEPVQFSHENYWCSIEGFWKGLNNVDALHWDRILSATGFQCESTNHGTGRVDDVESGMLSAYREGLADFSSPIKQVAQRF